MSDDFTTRVSELLELESIKRLKYAYFRCLDQKLWDEMGELFVEEATAAYSGGKYHYEGREEIVSFMRRNMDRPAFHTSHRVHHPEITLEGADRATGVWAMEDVNVDTEWDFYLTGAGFYTDTYVRRDGRWQFLHTGYKRTFETILPMSKVGMKVTASWWSTGGQSELEVT
ncbi:MAG TPA: nuclear transport factor 2 family protein [Microthrixaceae bacterium]|nr:nuclear transport factor 2 family protein [Microthrixaceae bacterium]